MLIFFILDARVVDLTPSSSAAPSSPEIVHFVCRSAARMFRVPGDAFHRR